MEITFNETFVEMSLDGTKFNKIKKWIKYHLTKWQFSLSFDEMSFDKCHLMKCHLIKCN